MNILFLGDIVGNSGCHAVKKFLPDIIKSKKESSMHLAVNAVKDKIADAVLSFGNTGALMSISLLNIKTLSEIKRPSIACIWPNMKAESIVLDLGANTCN